MNDHPLYSCDDHLDIAKRSFNSVGLALCIKRTFGPVGRQQTPGRQQPGRHRHRYCARSQGTFQKYSAFHCPGILSQID